MYHDSTFSAAAHARGIRALPDALAREITKAKPNSLRMVTLNSLYARLSPADKLKCQAEMHAIREARRVPLNEADALGNVKGAATVTVLYNPVVPAPCDSGE